MMVYSNFMEEFFTTNGKPRTAILLSGSGSNAEALLSRRSPEYDIVCIFTDYPEKSRAEELAGKYDVPFVALSIREFYREHGETRVSLATERGWEVREKWSQKLIELLEPYRLDFAVFAGFVPLCSLPRVMPCLNVHPGDLSVESASGERELVGLHTIPIERAILMGLGELRSSVIVVQDIASGGANMDAGPLLGVSGAMSVDLGGLTRSECTAIAAARPAKRPVGGYKDALEQVAELNQERLKYAGDHTVFPPVVEAFAAGRYRLSEEGQLFFAADGTKFCPVKTVEYRADGEILPRD